MNKISTLLVGALLVSTTAMANADSKGMYLLVEGGYAKMASKDKIPGQLNNKIIADKKLSSNITTKPKKASSAVFGLGAGYRFDSNLRSDLTLGLLTQTTSKFNDSGTGFNVKTKTSSFSTLVNAYYDTTAFGDSFTPYVGAGVGLAVNKYKLDAVNTPAYNLLKGNTASFAYQVGLGTLVKVTDSVNFKIGYRFADYGDVKTKKSSATKLKTHIRSHQVVAGLQFSL